MKYLNILFLLVYGLILNVQAIQLDSLDQVSNRQIHDTSRVNSLIDQGNSLYNTKPEQSLEYATAAAELAYAINYKKGIVNSHKLLGIAHWITGNYKKALEEYQVGLGSARLMGDSITVSAFLINIGVAYSDMGEYQKSMKSYLDALKLLEHTDRNRFKAVCYQNIGEIYKALGEFDNALSFNHQALEIFEKINDRNGIAVIYNNNSDIQIEQGKLKLAYENLTLSREIFEEIKNARGVSITTNTIGEVLLALGRFTEAQRELQQSIALKTAIDDKHGLVSTMQNLGSLKMKQKQYDSAQFYFEEALILAQQIGLKEEEITLFHSLSKLFEQMNLYAESLLNYKNYTALKDSVFGIEKNKQIVFLQTLYDTEKRNKENIMLKKNQEINEQRLKQQETKSELYAFLLLFAIIFFGVLGYAFYQKHKSNQELKVLNRHLNDKTEEIELQAESLKEANRIVQELNLNLESKVEERTQQLLDFSFKNSHEIRGPLSRILGLINLYKENNESLTVGELLKKLENSAIELDEIVREINNILRSQEFANKGSNPK